jgi:hypothetical protein
MLRIPPRDGGFLGDINGSRPEVPRSTPHKTAVLLDINERRTAC